MQGCNLILKSFDLSKIRANSLKIWAKMAPTAVLFEKWCPTFA